MVALRFRARHADMPDPVGPLSERVLVGFRRAPGRRPLRDAALIAVASDALLGVSEVAALEVADIDWNSSTILVCRSKTDQEGEVLYLGEPTLKRVRE